MQKRHLDFQDDHTDENETSKNVHSNMKKLENSKYFSNPSRLLKQKIPEFEPRPNDLNALISNQQINGQTYKSIGLISFPGSNTSVGESNQQKINFQPYSRNGSQPSIYQLNNQNQQIHSNISIENGNINKIQNFNSNKHYHGGGQAEEDINDNDFSSSEFDVSENEAIGPSHNINQSILNQYKNTFFNQKIKEFNERKARCHTLLPQQAQKYFRDHKTAKSYIEQSPHSMKHSRDCEDSQDSPFHVKSSYSINKAAANPEYEYQQQIFPNKQQRNKSVVIQRVTSFDNNSLNSKVNLKDQQNDEYLAKKQKFHNEMQRLQQQQDKFQNQIAQILPQSVLDSNKFNLNFNNQQTQIQNQQLQKKQQVGSSMSSNKYQIQSQINQNHEINHFNENNLNHQKVINSNQMNNNLQQSISMQQSPVTNKNPTSLSSTAASSFSTNMPLNRPISFSNSIHKQVKEETIQKQITKSEQIQAKLEQQSKHIEEKKAAFQVQLLQKAQNVSNDQNKIYQNIIDQKVEQQNKIISPKSNSIHSQNSKITQKENYYLQGQDGSKISNLISPNMKQNQDFQNQDSDMLNVKQNISYHQNNSQIEIPQDIQSRSSISQKQGYDKQSSFKVHQTNFMNQQFLQTNDQQNRKSKKSSQNFLNDHDFLSFPENETFVGTINTIDIRVDTQTIKTGKPVDKKEQNRLIDSEMYDSLIRAIFSSNIQSVESIIKSKFKFSKSTIYIQALNLIILKINSKYNNTLMLKCQYSQFNENKGIVNEERYHLINQIDEKGNTPLLLAVKLAYSNPNYYTIVKILLKHDSDPRIRDKQDWSCFEEVASQKDYLLASLLFESLINFKKRTLIQQKREIDNMLSDVPDFYLEMKWEFESNIIPFVSKIAPSDTFKIWKYGRSVRCDSTFAGIQKYRAKRRAQSLIFNSLNLSKKTVSVDTETDFLTIVQKEEKTFHFPLQEPDVEEKKKIVQDLLSSSESIQGNLKIEKTTIAPSKSFFGSKNTQKIQGYMCDKYDLQLRYRYMIFKKTRIPFLQNYEKYMISNTDLSPTKSISTPHDMSYHSYGRNESIQQPVSCQTSMKEIKLNGIDNGNPFEIQITETNKNEVKKQTLGLYVSDDFPLKFKVFMPLLQFLSNGNQLLMNLYEVFKDPSVNDIIFKKGFPVKVQIPLSYSIYANITFSSYKPLSCCENENVSSLFNIPNDAVFMNRKEKQNTMKKQKKRLMLANLYLS